jgi:cytochrome b6-f complex iron-sulfur subunit
MVTRALPGECPLEKSKVTAMPRRTALRFLLGTVVSSVVSLLYPVLRYLVPPPDSSLSASEALAARIDELKPNSGKTFRFGSRPALLVRLASGEYRSTSAVCTHLGCTVQYRPETAQIWCACHNGCYDLNGRNVSGPPPRALDTYDVNVRGQEIYVIRKQAA